MELKARFFNELNTKELYEILKARAAVFTVEQQILYQDMDDVDYRALHIFLEEDGRVVAYLRAFEQEQPDTVRIGRVLTLEHGKGNGKFLLGEALRVIREKMHPNTVEIESQVHAIGFYERAGFVVCSEEFMDAGIPHKKMLLHMKNDA